MSKVNCLVSVIVPAFNEASTIGDVVRRIAAIDSTYEVIVVDDGSGDNTAAAAAAAGARVIRHTYNLGNGASITTGAGHAVGDVIVMIDADGQHPPEYIPALVALIGEYDMVVGARTRQSKTSRRRRFGNFLLNSIARWISGHPIVDLTSGFRAIRRTHLLEYVHLFPARYSYPTTITMAMIQGRHFVKYVPIDSIQRRYHGKSNIRPVRDFIRFINIMMRLLILFSPQKFFLPLSAMSLVAGLLLAIHQLVSYSAIYGSSQLLLMSAVYFFCFGLLAEQIATMRRERSRIFTQTGAIVQPANSQPFGRDGQRQIGIDERQKVEGK
ncbi:MAG: glycosyltransferase family 2 protein [Ferrovibrio sp.]|uniref:glycosyltransferase family 2 protein n=1 Tax=Ferrovibrio sp. TaxID=1917215 RepID=UPI002637B9A2|nr:glycosyltransferase family 2 protein [Ferrovibrio sp.]MCW0234577.1 glycosyltransferase family 2 protein [Ferrovibrio sp.]